MTFGFGSTALDVVGGLDLRGRNVVVTGGASGLGAARFVARFAPGSRRGSLPAKARASGGSRALA
jgi:NAD(P)-dependent dehydrogenase (short-subunit alcohol dehydrogenase family)